MKNTFSRVKCVTIRHKVTWFTVFSVYTDKEIRRLKWNWLFLMLVCTLETINYTSVLPTFHQFITNPTAEVLNETGRLDKVSLVLYTHN